MGTTDPASPPLIETLVEALAEREGTAPTVLDYTLYEYIDPHVLRTLAARTDDPDSWRLSLDVAGHAVTIDSEGRLDIDGTAYGWGPAAGGEPPPGEAR